MNHNLRRAAYLNSTGANQLAFGETRKAFRSFRGSLQTLALAIVEIDQAPQPPLEEEVGDNVDEMIARAIPRNRMGGELAEHMHRQLLSSNDGNAFLYGKGMIFYPKGQPGLADLAFYSAVIVFNLVLSFHRKSSDLKDRELTKLLQLYDLVLSLIGESARSPQNDCCNLMIAACNNKSVVYSELGQHVGAQRMLYHVWDIMRLPPRRPPLLDGWEVEGIFLNIYLMLVNAPRVAGAA